MANGTARAARVALLRGINVGTAKRVAMADLRLLFEELGYTTGDGPGTEPRDFSKEAEGSS